MRVVCGQLVEHIRAIRIAPTKNPHLHRLGCEHNPCETVVYAIQQGIGGPIKIGLTKSVETRLKSLQTANPFPLRLLGTIVGNDLTEAHLHQFFDEYRLVGEWFHPSKECLQLIEAVFAGKETA